MVNNEIFTYLNSGHDIANLKYGRILLECLEGEDEFLSVLNIDVTYNNEHGEQTFTLPKGMFTDLASVPRTVWFIVPPHRRIKRAAVIHDGLYQFRPMLTDRDGKLYRMTRGEADTILAVACLKEGMHINDVNRVYQAVRIGGSRLWHSHDIDFGVS